MESIFNDELWRKIQVARTNEQAKQLAGEILRQRSDDIDFWREGYKKEGIEEGRQEIIRKFRSLLELDIEPDTLC